MATLYITEYKDVGHIGGVVPIAKAPAIVEQTVSISGTSAASSAFVGNLIRLHTDAICSVLISTNPTATTAKTRLAANQTEYFAVNPGDKVAVITNT